MRDSGQPTVSQQSPVQTAVWRVMSSHRTAAGRINCGRSLESSILSQQNYDIERTTILNRERILSTLPDVTIQTTSQLANRSVEFADRLADISGAAPIRFCRESLSVIVLSYLLTEMVDRQYCSRFLSHFDNPVIHRALLFCLVR
jgi:hypothetical protein